MKFPRVFLVCCFLVGTKSMSIQNITLDGGKYVTVEMFESLKRNMTEIISDLASKGLDKSSVYFYVTLSSDHTYNTKHIVRFNNVYYNEGKHFNSEDSVFVVPVTGVYLFSWSLQNYPGKNSYTELRVAGVAKGYLNMITSSSYSERLSSTRVVICTANKDDHVWIQIGTQSTENYLDDFHSSESSFMGVLLFQKT